MPLARAVLFLCLVLTGQVMATIGFADEIPLCARPIDPSTFTSKGTKVRWCSERASLSALTASRGMHRKHWNIMSGDQLHRDR